MTETLTADVVVVGGGNAALSAALAAAEAGARVRLLEAAPKKSGAAIAPIPPAPCGWSSTAPMRSAR